MRWSLLVPGSLLLALAVVLLARDPGEPAGALWASIDANSLVGFGALVEKGLDPDLWTEVLLPVLTWPAWIPPLALGALLAAAARPWRRREAPDDGAVNGPTV